MRGEQSGDTFNMFLNLEEEDVDSWGRWLPGSSLGRC